MTAAAFTGRASDAERAIRMAVVAKIRELRPEARIIHELNVEAGMYRADLAAVEPGRITLFEIKSHKDTLDRVDDQMIAFQRVAHQAVLVADLKWFDTTPYIGGQPRLVWPCQGLWTGVWCYPEPKPLGPSHMQYVWTLREPGMRQPAPRKLLELCWRDELYAECRRKGLPVKARSTAAYMVDLMAFEMTGREIVEAVCRRLRARTFVTADPAVPV